MQDTLMKTTRGAMVGVFLALGVHGATSTVAQDVIDPEVDTVTTDVDDDGFDDWGLLGLLGLAGLAGLLKRPTQEVHTINRTNDPLNRTTDPIDRTNDPIR